MADHTHNRRYIIIMALWLISTAAISIFFSAQTRSGIGTTPSLLENGTEIFPSDLSIRASDKNPDNTNIPAKISNNKPIDLLNITAKDAEESRIYPSDNSTPYNYSDYAGILKKMEININFIEKNLENLIIQRAPELKQFLRNNHGTKDPYKDPLKSTYIALSGNSIGHSGQMPVRINIVFNSSNPAREIINLINSLSAPGGILRIIHPGARTLITTQCYPEQIILISDLLQLTHRERANLLKTLIRSNNIRMDEEIPYDILSGMEKIDGPDYWSFIFKTASYETRLKILDFIDNYLRGARLNHKGSGPENIYPDSNDPEESANKALSNPINPYRLLYIKEDSPARFQMLETFNQLRLRSQEFIDFGLEGDPYMRVAILDRGVDPTHPAIQGKDIFWKDFTVMEYPTPRDYVGHGTAIASIIAGNPYNATDSEGRTVISMIHRIDWGGVEFGWNTSLTYVYYLGAVNVSSTGNLIFEANWTKPANSDINIKSLTILNQQGQSIKTNSTFPQNTFTRVEVPINSSEDFGIYRFAYYFTVADSADSTEHTIEGFARVPIAVINQSCSDPDSKYYTTHEFRGIAPKVDLALLRVEYESEIVNALEWLLENGSSYNITLVDMSLVIRSLEVIDLVNTLATHGILVVAAAGNYGPGGNHLNTIDSAPATADYIVTVGAIARNNSISSFSAQGGTSYSGETIKPDIVAPGGEFTDRYDLNTPLILADANPNEFLYEQDMGEGNPVEIVATPEMYPDDNKFMQGTSFSAPIVVGVLALMIEKMGGMKIWNYTLNQIKALKSILLMTASETAPALRDGYDGAYSPELDRGGKDAHEGYGKINPVAALSLISNYTQYAFTENMDGMFEVKNISEIVTMYSAAATNENIKHSYKYPSAVAFPYRLLPTYYYRIEINALNTSQENDTYPDVDIYIYYNGANRYGEPILFYGSTTDISGTGLLELKNGFIIENPLNVYIVIKCIKGFGKINISVHAEPDTFMPDKIIIHHPQPYQFIGKNLVVNTEACDKETGIRKAAIIVRELTGITCSDSNPAYPELNNMEFQVNYISSKSYYTNTETNRPNPADQGQYTFGPPIILFNSTYSSSLEADLSGLESGWYEFYVIVYDAANNENSSTPFLLPIDTSSPQITIESPESSTYQYDYIVFKYSVSDDFSGVERVELYIHTLNQMLLDSRDINYNPLDNITPCTLQPNKSPANTTMELTLKFLTNESWDGDQIFYFKVYDKAGNVRDSGDIILYIQNHRFHTIEKAIFISLSILTYVGLNYVAKQILLKVDLDRIPELPYRIRDYIINRIKKYLNK